MASSSRQTYYEILGISKEAKVKEVRDAYHKLALKYHPDKDPCNPRAVAAFQMLGAAYETLSDVNSRTKYDTILSSNQRAKQSPQPTNWPPQTSSDPNTTTRMRQENMRREDSAYWSGPTYAHGATDRQQKDREDLHEHEQQQRSARKKARREAERKKSHMDTRPPPRDPFDQGTEEFKTGAEGYEGQHEAWGEAEREKHEDDGDWGRPLFPQRPDPDWSDKVKEGYRETPKRAKKERSSHRKAEREQYVKRILTELPHLLSKIISIQVDIWRTRDRIDESRSPTKDEREDDNYEQIFELPIRRKSLEKHLKECRNEYKRIVRLLRDRGREQEANEAHVKLREARKDAARSDKAGREGSSQREQSGSTTETQAKREAGEDKGKPSSVNNERPSSDQNLSTPQARKACGGENLNAEQRPETTLPMYDGQYDEDSARQQRPAGGYMNNPGVSFDGSDPDQGFTEYTPEPSTADEDNVYDDSDYDPPFCNDFHDSHMEVHKEFWDIIDSLDECYFCHNVCTVMRCPSCEVQACSYCKDRHG